MSVEQGQRIRSAIVETESAIAEEMGYRRDLRKADRLAFLESHRAKLVAALNNSMSFCVECGSFYDATGTKHSEWHQARRTA